MANLERKNSAMRKDMQKIITERERHGSSDRGVKTRLRIRPIDVTEDDDRPARLSRKQLYGGMRKGFSDYLSPLRGFLRKNLGRPWDNVYSEIRETLDDRSLSGQHVFQHLWMEVERHVVVGDDGTVWEAAGGRRRTWPIRGFYVHPKTGLLEQAPRYKPPRERGEPDAVVRRRISATASYVKIAGIWYRCEYGESPAIESPSGKVPGWYYQHAGERTLHLVSKQQCGSRELRAAGLVNDPPAR
jgi:hypothetical protein